MNDQDIIRFIKEECEKNNITMVVDDAEFTYADSIPCTGYFDHDQMKLAIAIKAPKAILILIHEYCHMRQWIEQCDAWKEYEESDSGVIMDWWLARKIELTEEQQLKYFNIVAKLELDCEKRTVEFMKANGLESQVDVYIQSANAYILSYQFTRRLRSWNKPGQAPYNNPKVVEILPTTFVDVDFGCNSEVSLEILRSYV